MKIWTIGHSTRTDQNLGEILLAHKIEALVDVRTFPGSRRYPQFNKSVLSAFLGNLGINYLHEPRLGGRRVPNKDSHNTAWRNAQFRGYADHMETDEFKVGIKALLELSRRSRTGVMCAEAVWWRCHRRIIADYLICAGESVFHILGSDRVDRALLTPEIGRAHV